MTSRFFTVSRRSGESAVVSTSGGAFGSVVNVEFFFTGFRAWAPWLGWWRTVLTDWLWPADPLFAEAFTTRQHWPDEHRKAISTSLCVKVAYLELLNKWVFFLLRGEGEEKWWPKRGLNCRGVAMERLVVVGPYYQLGVRNSTISIYHPNPPKKKQPSKEATSQTFSCPRNYFSPPTFSTEQHYQQSCYYSRNPKLQQTRIWARVGGGGGGRRFVCQLEATKKNQKIPTPIWPIFSPRLCNCEQNPQFEEERKQETKEKLRHMRPLLPLLLLQQ